jgi:putative oxidoreductase
MPAFKLNSTAYSSRSLDFSLLILRLGFGILMMPHGYAKLVSFADKSGKFMPFMGLSGPASLSLTIFAELFCAGLIALGLFTRLAAIPLIILTLVIVFVAHQGDIFDTASAGFFYLLAYTVIFLVGPGKYSLDYAINKKLK